MQIETKIEKLGNGLALQVSGIMAEVTQFESGTRVTVDVHPDGLFVRRSANGAKISRFQYSESDLLEGMTAETAHAEVLAEPTSPEMGG